MFLPKVFFTALVVCFVFSAYAEETKALNATADECPNIVSNFRDVVLKMNETFYSEDAIVNQVVNETLNRTITTVLEKESYCCSTDNVPIRLPVIEYEYFIVFIKKLYFEMDEAFKRSDDPYLGQQNKVFKNNVSELLTCIGPEIPKNRAYSS